MFRKITAVTTLSAAILFGGTLSTVDASASANQPVSPEDNIQKMTVSMNGACLSKEEIQRLIASYYSQGNEFNVQEAIQSKTNASPKDKEKATKKIQKASQGNNKSRTPNQAGTAQPNQEVEEHKAKNNQPSSSQKQTEKEKTVEQAKSTLNQMEEQVVDLTNKERKKQGLQPLKINNELSNVAREKSRDMAVNGYFSHQSPTYGSPFDMMKKYGITYRTAGENIAKGQKTPEQVVQAWMNSEGHRKNILNPNYTEIGVGYIEKGNVWTQQFIGK